MLTGMRAMDMEGRITYVNAAYCSMTGFSESELIGKLPPYPHWPPERMEELPPAGTGAPGAAARREDQRRSCAATHPLRRADVRLAADRRQGQPDGLDDLDDQHHRGAPAHPRPALGRSRAVHHRPGGAGCRGVGGVGAGGRTAVRQPLVPGVVRGDARGHTHLGRSGHPGEADVPLPDEDDGGPPERVAGTGAHRGRHRPARGVRRVAGTERSQSPLPAMDRRAPGADAHRHRRHRPLQPRNRRPSRRRRLRSPAVWSRWARWPRPWRTSEPAADRHFQRRQRHHLAGQGRRDQHRRPARRPREDRQAGAAPRRADHSPHPYLREEERASAATWRRPGRSSRTRWSWR